jgi:hypothetical protein
MRWFLSLALALVLAAPAQAQLREEFPVPDSLQDLPRTYVQVAGVLYGERTAARIVEAWQLRSNATYACAFGGVAVIERGPNVGKTAWAINSFTRQSGPIGLDACDQPSHVGMIVFVDNLEGVEQWQGHAASLLMLRNDLHFIVFVYGYSRVPHGAGRTIVVPEWFVLTWTRDEVETNAANGTR